MQEPLNLVVILGTAREGRRSQRVMPHLAAAATDRDWKITEIDVADHLQEGTDRDAGDEAFRSQLTDADAFVIVTPEYNHGYPGELKMLLDRQQGEFAHKPVGLIGVSAGRFGGSRVTDAILPVMVGLGAVPVTPQVLVGSIGGEEEPFVNAGQARQLDGMFNELAFYGRALKRARLEND